MSNFEKAVSQSCLEWASSLPETCEYTLSAASEKYFDKLLKRMEHGGFRPVSKHTLRFILIAAIIAALLAAITIGVNIGEQSFEIIPNGDMAQYSVIDPAEPLLATDLTVNYTVPGFKLKDTMYDPDDKISGYEYAADNGKCYYIDRCQSASVIHINNEGSGFSSFEHNGITFVYYPADNGYIGLMWNYSGYVYSVDGQISLDEALKVADSINY